MSLQIPGLPAAPTDNLHKFRALAGLWLVFGTFTALGFAVFHLQRVTFDLELRLSKVTADRMALLNQINVQKRRVALAEVGVDEWKQANLVAKDATDAANSYVQQLKQLASGASEEQVAEAERLVAVSDRLMAEATRIREETLRRTTVANDAMALLGSSQAALENETADVAITVKHLLFMAALLAVLLAVGISLVVGGYNLARQGFRSWSRIQDTQDRHLEQQLVSLKASNRAQREPAEDSPAAATSSLAPQSSHPSPATPSSDSER